MGTPRPPFLHLTTPQNNIVLQSIVQTAHIDQQFEIYRPAIVFVAAMTPFVVPVRLGRNGRSSSLLKQDQGNCRWLAKNISWPPRKQPGICGKAYHGFTRIPLFWAVGSSEVLCFFQHRRIFMSVYSKKGKDLKCSDITSTMIEDYIIKRSKVSSIVANKELQYLRAFFNYY